MPTPKLTAAALQDEIDLLVDGELPEARREVLLRQLDEDPAGDGITYAMPCTFDGTGAFLVDELLKRTEPCLTLDELRHLQNDCERVHVSERHLKDKQHN